MFFNARLRCGRAGFSPHLLLKGKDDFSSTWAIGEPAAAGDADALQGNLVHVFPPNRSQGESELGFCTAQKMLPCWLFRCHKDHAASHLLSLVNLKFCFVRMNKEVPVN